MSDPSPELAAFLEALGNGPRRRARPRSAPSLANAHHEIIDGVATWRSLPGPAVLLVHGWEDDHSLWDPLIEALDQVGRPVVAIDLPGHGFSPAAMGSMLDAAAAIGAVAAACGPIDACVGHSYGAPCLVTAIEETSFAPARVALIAAPIAQRDQIARRAARYEAPPGAVEALIARVETANGRSVDWFDLRRAARGMQAAGMIVHSIDDDVCPIDHVQTMAEVWAGGAELLLTDGLGHRDVARDAGVVARLVDFLA